MRHFLSRSGRMHRKMTGLVLIIGCGLLVSVLLLLIQPSWQINPPLSSSPLLTDSAQTGSATQLSVQTSATERPDTRPATTSAKVPTTRATTATRSTSTNSPTTTTDPVPAIDPTSEASVLAPTAKPTPRPTARPTPRVVPKPKPGYVAYLTFDDGPSERTPEVTAILAHYGIKATFFVNNKSTDRSKQILHQTAEKGHAIGLHTASHNYKIIYSSVSNFMTDLDKNARFVKRATGQTPLIMRFPGGSINDFNRSAHADYTAAVLARGYVYFDWNCSSGDSSSTVPSASKILRNVLKSAGSRKRLIILCHDSPNKRTTVQALPRIIEALQDRGYSFAKLTPRVAPVRFG